MEFIKVAVMGLQEAKELQQECLGKGIELMLNHDEKTCTRGCSVTVEIHAKEDDLAMIEEIYSLKYKKILEGHDFDSEIINSVYDPSAESVTCPACAYIFSPENKECPDCGLVLG